MYILSLLNQLLVFFLYSYPGYILCTHMYIHVHVYACLRCQYFSFRSSRADGTLSLTQRLVGALGANWKILAAPLSISDCCRESIDHDERTLLLKVNKLLVTWVDTDERNDRNALATLLGSVAGFDLAQHCREALKKTV